jgi:hypothetical protein
MKSGPGLEGLSNQEVTGAYPMPESYQFPSSTSAFNDMNYESSRMKRLRLKGLSKFGMWWPYRYDQINSFNMMQGSNGFSPYQKWTNNPMYEQR